MLRMCAYMHSRFIENHPIQILEDGPLIFEGVLSQPPDLSTARPPSIWPVRPSPVLCTRSPTPVTVLIAAPPRRTYHLHTTRQTNAILQWNKDKRKIKRKLFWIRIQTSLSQWLITIKPRNWPISFSCLLGNNSGKEMAQDGWINGLGRREENGPRPIF
jgi:hypothetical protein